MKFFPAILILFLGAGCMTASSDVTESGGGFVLDESEMPVTEWQFDGDDFDEVVREIPTQAKRWFGAQDGIEGDLSLIAAVPANVVVIPGIDAPQHVSLFVLRDEAGQLFVSYVESWDGELYYVSEFRSESGDMWPSESLRVEAAREKAEFVAVAHPVLGTQFYYKYGADAESARFVRLESGEEFRGLDDLFKIR